MAAAWASIAGACGLPPAGSTDVPGRLPGQALGKALQQTVVIENVGGAGGTIGAVRVARAAGDGHTLLFVARKSFPGDTLQAVQALARANPGKLNFAHVGVGATSQLCEVLLKQATGASRTAVPCKGTGPALNDLLGGQVDLICDQPAGTLGHIRVGAIKPIAVATAARLKILPAVATMAESGVPDFELEVWHGLYAPKGTPRPVLDKLAAALQVALREAALVDRYQEISAAVAASDQATPDALRRHLRSDLERWKSTLKAAGIQPE